MDMGGRHEASSALFAQVSFHIVISADLSPDSAREIARSLEENGAVEHSPPSNHGKVSLDGLTHIISTTIDFEGYDAAENALLPVATPGWVEASILKKRLANPKSHSADPRLFFSGLVFCTADLPDGDKDAIIGGVLAMGGLYSGAVSRLVTHLVALNMEPQACKIAMSRNLQCQIVLPHWFNDCIRLGKRIDERPYLLPDPEITKIRPEDPIPGTARPDLHGAVSTEVDRLPSPLGSQSQQRQNLNIFTNRTLMLSGDLEIGSHLRSTIEDLIKSGGGSVVKDVGAADTFICQYREGRDYQTASLDGKVVGNLPWLYHLITHNAWTSPLRRLLHYPIVRGGLPGFKKFRISLSNYNGEARIYLENLAKAAGCEFTKAMKMDNTHLITAHKNSEKCDAAAEWNINMINHLWLEESYAKWQIQSLANPKYTYFPPRTNLGEVVGKTQIDKQALERYFFPRSNKSSGELGDGDISGALILKMQNAPGISTAQRSKLPDDQSLSDRSRRSEETPPKVSRRVHRHSESTALRTPAPSKSAAPGKENETPSTTGSRSAKERAAAAIHDLAPDIALYEKERKRVGGVVFGGRKVSDEKKSENVRKRSISNESDTDNAVNSDAEYGIRDTKRSRVGKRPPLIRLLVTGYTKWTDNAKQYSDSRVRLRNLGILEIKDHTKCTHLAAPKILRTQNFLCAIAHAPVLISTNFLDKSMERNEELNPEDYLLTDPEGEKRFGLKLPEVLKRAKANKRRLLRNYSIYCTENVQGGFETYKAIIEANGGRCLLYRARAGSIAKKAAIMDGDDEDRDSETDQLEYEYVYLITGSMPEETRLWPKFRETVRATGDKPRVVRADWMLDLALRQEIKWEDGYEMTDKDIKA